ncbi:MAG TPA: phosphate-starvation-inducible PsiE family protein [Methylocella sp.]|nr:phosphate-starvation-inducible PsiE family protein [Methylocella sp.]
MAPEYSDGKKTAKFSLYLRFEWIALACLLIMLAAITVYAIAMTAIEIAGALIHGGTLFEVEALKETFGRILTILIVLEFSHSVHVAMTKHVGAIQARILVLIAILVIARKLILMDFTTIEAQMILALGGLLLSLGGLYWLISIGDRPEGFVDAQEVDAQDHVGELKHDPQIDRRAGQGVEAEKAI